MKTFNRVFTVLVFVFLYIPMVVLAVASFNTGNDIAVFKGFTFAQYGELFRDGDLLRLLGNSLIIAVLSSVLATILGTMAAVGLHGARGRLRRAVMTLTNIPMTNPDIVTGVSLALLFAFTGTLLKINSILGFWTLLIAHVTFNLPYVILSVLPKLTQMDPDLEEAALDLGCKPTAALFKVILPEIMPGVITGSLLAFTMSLDDFVISYFTSNTDQNLSMIVYSAAKLGVEPTMYAVSTLMFLVILALLLIINRRSKLEEI